MGEEKTSEQDLATALSEARREIGSLKEELQELSDECSFFRHAVQNAFNPILITDAELDPPGPRILYVNRAFTEMTGYAPEEVLGKTPRILQGSKTDRAVLDRLKMDLGRGESFHGETVNYRKDGREFLLEWQISPIRDGGGEITRFVSIQRDVTRLRQVESDLRKTIEEMEQRVRERTMELALALRDAEHGRDRLDAVLRSVADGVIVTDVRERVILMNRAAESLLGKDFEQVRHQPVEACAPWEAIREDFRRAVCGGDSEIAELSFPSGAKGEMCTVQIRSSHLANHHDRRIGSVAILRDISRAKEVERIKSDFITTAAHELRTPLTSVLGYAEVLLAPEMENRLDQKQRHSYLTEIRNTAEYLSNMIGLLLDLGRLEAGRPIPLQITSVDMGELLRRTVEHYPLRSSRHHLDLNIEDEEICLPADPNRLRQALENLLANAIKFSPEGGGIGITGKAHKEEYEVRIEDEGVGMTPEEVSHMFDHFYRADTSHTAVGGLGLGMSIVQGIIEGHGGRIEVQSTPRAGTCVRIYLPRASEF